MEDLYLKKKSLVTCTLQGAKPEDCELMFRLQKLDGAKINPEDADEIARFEIYKRGFAPSEIQVIYSGTTPVGRLRIVRDEDLYIGGLQILPEYRGKWIGTTILERLIEESKETLKSIRLEVFHSNTLALKLYKKLGFRVIDSNQIQKIMIYQPMHTDR